MPESLDQSPAHLSPTQLTKPQQLVAESVIRHWLSDRKENPIDWNIRYGGMQSYTAALPSISYDFKAFVRPDQSVLVVDRDGRFVPPPP